MESKSIQKPKRVLKKVKDFGNVYDYFSYATTEFGNDKLHYDGYNWTAEELFNLYLAGDKDEVMKLAVPESTDYRDIPLLKAYVEPPAQQVIKGKFCGPDIVRFPCKPALKSLEPYFKAKAVDTKLLNDPLSKNWWPDRHVDRGLAQLELMEAKENLCVSQRKYATSLVDIEKDREVINSKAEKLRTFTMQYNNLAYRNLFKKKESVEKIQADFACNIKKIQESGRLKERIEGLVIVREDLKVRIDKMQMYEDYLNSAVQCSNKKFNTIQQILDRYDVVAYMKKQIVRNHLNDMFEMDVQKGILVKLVDERKDTIRDFNNQMSDLARRYKYVVRRYQHWENAVQRLKKLCNKELAQTQSVEASVWNVYVQMCARKRMPVKEAASDYKAQLAYILTTIKQYEKIVQLAQAKHAVYKSTQRDSSVVSARRPQEKRKEQQQQLEVLFEEEKQVLHKATQTLDISYADVATMIWWDDELRTNEARLSEVEEEHAPVGMLTMLESRMMHESGDELLAGQLASGKDIRALQQEQEDRATGSQEQEALNTASSSRLLAEASAVSHSAMNRRIVAESTAHVAHLDAEQSVPPSRKAQRKCRAHRAPALRSTVSLTGQQTVLQAPDKPAQVHAASQTDAVDRHDKSEQYSFAVHVHVQTLDALQLEELAREQQLRAETARNLVWLNEASALNRKLMGACQVKADTAAVSSAAALRNVDLQADWFFPPEWRDTLVNMQDEEEEEEETWRYAQSQDADAVAGGGGRRTSAAMRCTSTELYASKRSDPFLASIMQLSRAAPRSTRDSLAVGLSMGGELTGRRPRKQQSGGLLVRPSQHESLALTDIGLLQKLQAILAARQKNRDEVQAAAAAAADVAKGTVLEHVLARVLVKLESVELAELVESKQEQAARRARRELRFEQPDDGTRTDDNEAVHGWEEGLYAAGGNQVDAWTQTPRDQSEDWVQTMPVLVAYGWCQTERIDELTQTEESSFSEAAAAVADGYAHVATQTETVADEEKCVEGRVQFVSAEEIKQFSSSETDGAEQSVTAVEATTPVEQAMVRGKCNVSAAQRGKGKPSKLKVKPSKHANDSPADKSKKPKKAAKQKSAQSRTVVQRKSSMDCTELTKPSKSTVFTKVTTQARIKPKKQ